MGIRHLICASCKWLCVIRLVGGPVGAQNDRHHLQRLVLLIHLTWEINVRLNCFTSLLSFVLHTILYVNCKVIPPSPLSLRLRCQLVICLAVLNAVYFGLGHPAAQSRGWAFPPESDWWCTRQVLGPSCHPSHSLLTLPVTLSSPPRSFYPLTMYCISQPLCRIFMYINVLISVPFCRLNVIFSKFDEVQKSGNMIASSGSGECTLLGVIIISDRSSSCRLLLNYFLRSIHMALWPLTRLRNNYSAVLHQQNIATADKWARHSLNKIWKYAIHWTCFLQTILLRQV